MVLVAEIHTHAHTHTHTYTTKLQTGRGLCNSEILK